MEFYTSSGIYLKKYHDLYYTTTTVNVTPIEPEYQDSPTVKEKGKRRQSVKEITPKLIEALPMHPLLLTTLWMDDGSVRNDCYAFSP